MRREASSDARPGGELAQLGAAELSAHARAPVGSSITQNSRPDGSRCAQRSRLSADHAHGRSRPRVSDHPSRDAPARAAPLVQIRLGEHQRLVDPQAGAPQHDDQPIFRIALAIARLAHHGHDLIDRRRIRGIPLTLVLR